MAAQGGLAALKEDAGFSFFAGWELLASATPIPNRGGGRHTEGACYFHSHPIVTRSSVGASPSRRRRLAAYSHSMVAGGLDEMS